MEAHYVLHGHHIGQSILLCESYPVRLLVTEQIKEEFNSYLHQWKEQEILHKDTYKTFYK